MTTKTKITILMATAGVVLAAIGILCFLYSGETLLGMAWLFGIAFLLAGCYNFMLWGKLHRFLPQSGLLFFSAFLQVLIGIYGLLKPTTFAEALPVVFAFVLLYEGVRIAIEAFDFKIIGFTKWWIMLLVGVLITVLGIFTLTQPAIGAKMLTILVGIGFVLSGCGYFVNLYAVTRFEKKLKRLHDRFAFVDAEEMKAD